MAQKRVVVCLDDSDFDELHGLKDLVHKREDGVILERIFEGNTLQQWYRIVMRKGMTVLRLDFENKKNQYENQDRD